MKTQPFFVELYNFHLSEKIPPLEEEKQKLTETILAHHTVPSLTLKHSTRESFTFEMREDKTVRKKDSEILGGAYPTKRGVYFGIGFGGSERYPEFGYCSPTLDWWKIDYPSFLEEYTRLRSFVDGYLERKLDKDDQAWFRKVLRLFTLEVTYSGSHKLTSTSLEFEPEIGKKDFLTLGIFPNTPDMTANELILAPAYLELIELFGDNIIERCTESGCNNIFYPIPGGKEQRYCSNACKQRAYRERQNPLNFVTFALT